MPEIQIQEGFEHDCNNCQGLCCVALAIDKEDGSSENKEAGTVCNMLEVDPENEATFCRCRIFSTLRKGRPLCEGFTCLGAGNTVSKFFKELGIHWAMKPANIDDETWSLTTNNVLNTYLIFHNIFLYLRKIRSHRHPAIKSIYESTRQAAQKIANELSEVLENGSVEVLWEDWYNNKFEPAMKSAALEAIDNHRSRKLESPKLLQE